MRTIAVILGALVLLAGAMGAQDRTAPDPAIEKLLIQNERALLDAVAKADKSAYQALVLPEGFWATPTGWVPMGPLADGLRSFALPTWGMENPHVVWTDGSSVLMLYIRTGGGSFDQHPFAPLTLASTLWTRRNGKWLAVYHQESDDHP